VQHLVKRKELLRLPSGLIFASAAIAGLVEDLRATGWNRFTIVAFKDRFGLSRKWTIPLLEHLDNVGVTRRVGEERELRAAANPSNAVKLNSAR
jgi:selenocysteine-specific elongation factor